MVGNGRRSGLPPEGSPSPAVAVSDPRGYLTYYGLRDPPFRGGVHPRHLWLGTAHREALAALTAAVQQGGGILVLTGDVGSGKSTLATQLVELLGPESLVVGRITGPIFELPDLFQALANAFHIGEAADGRAAERLRELLDGAARTGKKMILIVDEAQSLSDELLREVGDLSTLASSDGRHRLAVLLVGQNDLAAMLSKDQHAALSQRIVARCVLEPLTREEVGEYIRSSLRAVGFEGAIFDADAVRQIAAISRGAPGVINVVCERALRTGHARQAPVIGPEIIDACLGELPSRGALAPDRDRNRAPGGRQDAWPQLEDMGGPNRERRRPVRERRVSRGSALWISVLVAAILGTGGYGLHAGWFRSVRGDSPRHPAIGPPGAPSGRPEAQSAKPATEVKQPGGGDAGAPIAPPSREEPKRLADRDRREGKRLGAPEVSRPDRIRATRPPEDTLSRESPKPRETAREKEADDPGAVIDWLLKESGKR